MKHSPVHLLAIVLTGLSLAVHAGENPVLTEGFKRADRNNDGKLSADEVNQLPQLKKRLQGADKNGDGLITFDEFRTHLSAGSRPPAVPSSPVTRLGPGEHTRTITVGDLERRYRLHVPKNYDADHPTPVVLAFHGGGGKGVTDFKSVDHSIQNWVKANGCDAKPEIVPLPDKADDGMRVTRKTWGGGKDGSEVVLIEIEGGGHTWPGMDPPVAMLGKSTKDISANDLMWEFFQKHPMKQSPAPAPAPDNAPGKLKSLPDSDATRDAAGTGQMFEAIHVPGFTDFREGLNGFALGDFDQNGDGEIDDNERQAIREFMRQRGRQKGRMTPSGKTETVGNREVTEMEYASSDGREIPCVLSMPKGDGPFPCVVTIHGGHLALRAAELMGQELLCVAVGSPWMTDPFAYMAGDATKPPLSLVPEKARIALTENGKRLMSGLTRRTGSEEKANAVMREHSIEANAEKIGLERTRECRARECRARECRARECGTNDSRERECGARECGAREYGAVAALLTEPPSRPKVSGIAGDLRSASSARSETRAERTDRFPCPSFPCLLLATSRTQARIQTMRTKPLLLLVAFIFVGIQADSAQGPSGGVFQRYDRNSERPVDRGGLVQRQ